MNMNGQHEPIRLIELFSGIGCQAMALKRLGVDFTHWRAVDNDKFAVASYNAIHGTRFKPTDIKGLKGEDLGIEGTDSHFYVMCYSFPCQDLSVAGKRKGMTEDSGTRSSLLWEVRRLLTECRELPQALVMENVPAVHNRNNIKEFQKWLMFLEGLGYSTCVKDLDASGFGVPQSRVRCFAVSFLGCGSGFGFPKPFPLGRTIADLLEPEPDERYYIDSERADRLVSQLIDGGKLPYTKEAEGGEA